MVDERQLIGTEGGVEKTRDWRDWMTEGDRCGVGIGN